MAKDGATARSQRLWIPASHTVARTRQQLVEEGFEAVLTRKHSPASARPRIFDGAAEAKLIALACSQPPKGRARWTLQPAGGEGRRAEHRRPGQRQHDRADAQKNTSQTASEAAMGHPAGGQRRVRRAMEDVLEVYHRPHDPVAPWSAWTRPRSNSSPRRVRRSRRSQGSPNVTITSMSATAPPTCS